MLKNLPQEQCNQTFWALFSFGQISKPNRKYRGWKTAFQKILNILFNIQLGKIIELVKYCICYIWYPDCEMIGLEWSKTTSLFPFFIDVRKSMLKSNVKTVDGSFLCVHLYD